MSIIAPSATESKKKLWSSNLVISKSLEFNKKDIVDSLDTYEKCQPNSIF